jgi:hypothetical protein
VLRNVRACVELLTLVGKPIGQDAKAVGNLGSNGGTPWRTATARETPGKEPVQSESIQLCRVGTSPHSPGDSGPLGVSEKTVRRLLDHRYRGSASSLLRARAAAVPRLGVFRLRRRYSPSLGSRPTWGRRTVCRSSQRSRTGLEMTAIQRQHDEVIVRLSDTAERAHLWWWWRLLNRLHWVLNWAGCRFSGTLTEPSIPRRLTSGKTPLTRR